MNRRFFLSLAALVAACPFVRAEGPAWQTVASGVETTLRGVSFADKDNVWAVGDKGSVLHSKDAGATWEAVKTPSDGTLRAVHFIDKDRGCAVGDGDSDAANVTRGHVLMGKPLKAGSLLVTADGGANWTRIALQTNFEIRAIRMASENVGQICNHGGSSHPDGDTIVTTTGVKGWRQDRVYRGLNDCFWFDEQTAWAAGTRVGVGFIPAPTSPLYTQQAARIVHTTDGGKTWTPQSAPGGADLRRIRFVDKNTGVAVGDKGAILRTIDGGATWTSVKTDVTASLYGLAFTDAKHGWAVGAGGIILETNDAGETWATVTSPTTKNLLSVDAPAGGKSTVAVGADGAIIRLQ